ncbi:Protein CBG25936 [Caenorhabditis briggsae]|uniref:Protein CBG25936 n=1 Tax=Caenorhabditis briggsae TaxID=6238 RepID=B6IK68_CAEBR|nr:Protein CBG25936 [Caenorhabditis briggsae]CAS00298.1 Protein CBG25936 [Caenorhabditis briggsae]
MDSFKRYEETKLPSISSFYDKLNDKECSQKDYLYAKVVWNKMNCKNLEDYTRIYMINDVLLLADVFENFRNLSLDKYGLDPCWYYTSPGLSWDAMLKYTKVRLDTINDTEKFFMIEDGIRGGIVNAIKRYTKANNKYTSKFNPEEISNFLLYLDANNLYGWAMKQLLPHSNFVFEKQIQLSVLNISMNEVSKSQIRKYIENLNSQGKGCILEVDLEYPNELHRKHNEFPLCPEIRDFGNNIKKLCNTLENKNNYVIHYQNLLQALDLGMKLKKIKRILKFDESNWLASYIDLNTDLRKKAKNDFEKDFFKLMNNSVFGKTMENVRNRVDVKLIFSGETELMKNGETHYISKKDRIAKLAKLPNFNRNIIINKEYFDFSEYPECHPLYNVENKKVVGKFKDELNGLIMEELIALKPKSYAYKISEETRENLKDYYEKRNQEEKENPKLSKVPKPGEENKKSKGIKKCVVKKLKVEDFRESLFNKSIVRKKQCCIRSIKQQLYTQEQEKVVFDNEETEAKLLSFKRIIIPNSYETNAYGFSPQEMIK